MSLARPAPATPAPKPLGSPLRKRVTVLGSTGSVGGNTLDLIARNPDRFQVEALVARRDVAGLARQALSLKPALAVVAEESCYGALKEALAGSGVAVAAGASAVLEAAERPADLVMAAIVGAAGLAPTLAAIRRGAVIGLANKETLVCAGALMTAEVERSSAQLIPVDSEHSAIFQVLDQQQRAAVERIILTASGGPFRTLARAEMACVTPAQAVAHPNWDMGAKVSVDSATMMNKGLEVIEAHHLFQLSESEIEILVHPQSVVHSLVAYRDGSLLAQLGSPDMRTPIAYALAWPERMAAPVERLDLARIGSLTFETPDEARFPAIRLARHALAAGGGAPAVLNAANEEAVAAFLAGQIDFLRIAGVVAEALSSTGARPLSSLEELAELDAETRRLVRGLLGHWG